MRDLLRVWPSPLAAVANETGVDPPAVRAFVSGKNNLTDAQLVRLRILLNIEPDESGIPLCGGPYLVVSKSVRAAVNAYETITSGGDISFAIEAAPMVREERVMPDTRWHLLVFQRYFDPVSFAFLPRKLNWRESRLDQRALRKFINMKTLGVDSGAYEDWVNRLSESMHDPRILKSELLSINREYRKHFGQIAIHYSSLDVES